MDSKPVKSPISWPGAKRRLLKHLLPLLPSHKCYVEVFGGGASLLLAKPRSNIEVYNDVDGDLVAFFRNVRYHLDALLFEIEWTLNSRRELADMLAQPGLTEIQRVARWFVRNKISFGGQGRSFGTSKVSGGASLGSRANRLTALRELNARLDSVCIERLSWEKLIPQYDSEHAFFFADPPYFSDGGSCYGAFQPDDLARLLDALKAAKGRWILTFEDNQTARNIFAGCHLIEIERQRLIENRRGAGRTYRELIVTDQSADQALAA
ncbi:MAG: DNA adenine methylase [Opitutaceae bacterium]|jgi:DNA adenine methylase